MKWQNRPQRSSYRERLASRRRTSPVRSFPPNGYGVYDMVGNLHEWTNDPNGTFQGGYYLDTHKNGDGCSYRTVASNVASLGLPEVGLGIVPG